MEIIDSDFLASLTAKAVSCERKRTNYNFHNSPEEEINSLVIIIEKGSYIRPHRHQTGDKKELLVVLSGKLRVLTFTEEGAIAKVFTAGPGCDVLGYELDSQTFHSCVALEHGTTFLEVKKGPYLPIEGSDVAAWAPAEKTPLASAMVQWYLTALPGERFNGK